MMTRSACVMFLICLALTQPAPARAAGLADAALTESDTERLTALLESTRDELLERLAPLDDAAWSYQPEDGGWSIAEIVDHLVLAEESFQNLVQRHLEAPIQESWEATFLQSELALQRVVGDRRSRLTAPTPTVPSAQRSRSELISLFKAGRSRSLASLRSMVGPVKARTLDQPPFGPVSAYHWVLLTGLHNRRHNIQLLEVLADPGLAH